jgi:hypothetical protein
MASGTAPGGSGLGDIDFSAFVISLGSNAAMQLDPTEKSFDLDLAKQTIDILAMLEQKTAGNLTKEEDELLRNVLHEARLAWRELSRATS